jgi:hypothetical protein
MATAPPFYSQITPVLTDSVDLPLVSLPAGTVLFRGMRLPKADADTRTFYRDYLGDPEGQRAVCLNPTHNTFFYPFPHIAFGTADVGSNFDLVQMVVLVHPVTVVCSLSPSTWVRGTAKAYSGNAPYQRCSTVPAVKCHELSADELEASSYDNCLNPEYQAKSGVRGWMALAERDSLTKRTSMAGAALGSMGTYIKALDARNPGVGVQLAAWSYTDSNRNAGFPEIALYPYKVHKGNSVIKRMCPNNDAAMRLMQKEAADDNLNYLPIAAFTKEVTVDMVNGLFTYDRLASLPVKGQAEGQGQGQGSIERRVQEFMDEMQTKGISLPLYGNGKLSFDGRTGFYILSQVISRKLFLTSGHAGQKEKLPYKYLTLPLSTEEERKRVMNYILIFRTFAPDKFLEKFGLDKGIGVRRAMIFNRPPQLSRLFMDLNMEVPAAYRGALGRASFLYQKESGSSSKAPKASAAPLATKVTTLAPDSTTPTYAPMTPPYASMTPPYESTTPEESMTPPYASTTPNSPQYVPSGPVIALPPGLRDLRGGTRKINKRPNKTLKKSKKTIYDIAKSFSKIWASLK